MHFVPRYTLCLLILVSSAAWADVDKNVVAENKYSAATQLFMTSAEHGDAAAQYRLGVMYTYGQGVPQDDYEAVKWFRRAAKQGHVQAEYNLGLK